MDSKWIHLNWKGEESWVIVNTIAGFQIMENKNNNKIWLIKKKTMIFSSFYKFLLGSSVILKDKTIWSKSYSLWNLVSFKFFWKFCFKKNPWIFGITDRQLLLFLLWLSLKPTNINWLLYAKHYFKFYLY